MISFEFPCFLQPFVAARRRLERRTAIAIIRAVPPVLLLAVALLFLPLLLALALELELHLPLPLLPPALFLLLLLVLPLLERDLPSRRSSLRLLR